VSILSSTTTDLDPQLSPDGTKAAFVTTRSGRGPEVWVAALDGTRATRLTQPTGRGQGSPRWSPDGRWIAFDAQADDGNYDIYVVDAAGGQPRRLTTHRAFEHFASWSRDGKWIYFRSSRSGRSEIWRIPGGGGDAVQMTTTGGASAWESWDGQTLYYSRHDGNGPEGLSSGVFARPVGGGQERQVLDSIFRWDFFPAKDGIYYVALVESRRFNLLELTFLSFATGKRQVLSRFQARTSQGLSVSADGKTILYSGRAPGAGADLVLIQNFH
jgi:dipeptidyl aminopeptidase/acylaminoacyl peptidase